MLAAPPGKPPGKAPGCGPAIGDPGICPPYNPVITKVHTVSACLSLSQQAQDSGAQFTSTVHGCFETKCQISFYLAAEEEIPEVLVAVGIQLHSMEEGEAVN